MKKIYLIIFALIAASASGQEKFDSSALIVIDIQDFYFPGGDVPLNEPVKAAQNALEIITSFREQNMPVVYIKHNYEPGGSVNEIVKPLPGEKIFSKVNVNSFLGTGLDEYLKTLNIGELIICGMQTHMCVEAATRAAADMGYRCTVIDDACATRDLKYGDNIVSAKDVHYSTLSTLKSYAKIITTKEYLNDL